MPVVALEKSKYEMDFKEPYNATLYKEILGQVDYPDGNNADYICTIKRFKSNNTQAYNPCMYAYQNYPNSGYTHFSVPHGVPKIWLFSRVNNNNGANEIILIGGRNSTGGPNDRLSIMDTTYGSTTNYLITNYVNLHAACISNTGTVYLSNATVIYKHSPGDTSLTTVHDFGTNEIRAIGFYNDTIGYVLRASGAIFKTTDGGSTWSVVAGGIASTNIGQFIFLGDENNYVLLDGDGKLFRTYDGGVVRYSITNFLL